MKSEVWNKIEANLLLDDKVPYSGSTTRLDMNSKNIKNVNKVNCDSVNATNNLTAAGTTTTNDLVATGAINGQAVASYTFVTHTKTLITSTAPIPYVTLAIPGKTVIKTWGLIQEATAGNYIEATPISIKLYLNGDSEYYHEALDHGTTGDVYILIFTEFIHASITL
jgi:hypothetical protein